jgi:hypothetical protein
LAGVMAIGKTMGKEGGGRRGGWRWKGGALGWEKRRRREVGN